MLKNLIFVLFISGIFAVPLAHPTGEEDDNISQYIRRVPAVKKNQSKTGDLMEKRPGDENPNDVSQNDFELCPDSHPTAFDNGRRCCKSFEPNLWSNSTCDGDVVDCSSPPCEAYRSLCSDCLSLCKAGLFLFRSLKTDSFETLEANRPVYQSDETCMWWHRPGRHWWIGSCDDIGTDAGYAYLEKDLDCPDDIGKGVLKNLLNFGMKQK